MHHDEPELLHGAIEDDHPERQPPTKRRCIIAGPERSSGELAPSVANQNAPVCNGMSTSDDGCGNNNSPEEEAKVIAAQLQEVLSDEELRHFTPRNIPPPPSKDY